MKRRTHPSFLVAALIAAALTPSAAFAEVDALVRDALEMTQKGQAKQAFDLLSAQEEKRAGDPDFDAVLGIAANEAGELVTHLGDHPSLKIGALLETHKHGINDILLESLEAEMAEDS